MMPLSWLPVICLLELHISVSFFVCYKQEILVQQVESKERRKLCGMVYERIQEKETM